MILADGVVDSRELETVYRIGRENYGLSAEEIMSTVRDSGTSFILPDNNRREGRTALSDG